MTRTINLDGVAFVQLGSLLLPIVDLTDQELDGLLSDTEPLTSPARDSRPWEPAPPSEPFYVEESP
jgi:hypothetical protein